MADPSEKADGQPVVRTACAGAGQVYAAHAGTCTGFGSEIARGEAGTKWCGRPDCVTDALIRQLPENVVLEIPTIADSSARLVQRLLSDSTATHMRRATLDLTGTEAV